MMWIPGFIISLASYLNPSLLKETNTLYPSLIVISLLLHVLIPLLSFWLWKQTAIWFGSPYPDKQKMFLDKSRFQYFLNGTIVMLSLVIAFESMMRVKISACDCGCQPRTLIMNTACFFLSGYSLTQIIKGWAFSWVKKLENYTKKGLWMMSILLALNFLVFMICINGINSHHFPLFMYMPVFTAWFVYFCTRYKNKDCWIYPLAYFTAINFWIHLWGVSEILAAGFLD